MVIDEINCLVDDGVNKWLWSYKVIMEGLYIIPLAERNYCHHSALLQ